jgi:hypothetical protein
MNRNLFLQMLAPPDSVSEAENIALKKFTEDFPYCQTGQLLFVKHLHSEGSVHYPEQLKVAAAYAGDRKILYQLIHADVKEVVVVEASRPHPQPLSLKRGERTDESSGQTLEEFIPEKNIIEESTDKQDIIQKRLQEISAFKKEETSSPPVTAPSVTEPVEVTAPEIIPVAEEIKVPEPEIVLQKEEVPPVKIISERKEADITNEQHSFTQWLKTVKKEPVRKTKEEEKKTKPATSSDEIISRFIETEPRIVPSKAQFYNPVKMAKQSLEEHDDLVSETLAGIFAQQGNLPKAIEMYKKLLLIYPEKNAFFAALIEKLTHLLNTGK